MSPPPIRVRTAWPTSSWRMSENCTVCMKFRCDVHRRLLQCQVPKCCTTWDDSRYVGCPSCLGKWWMKSPERPKRQERCCWCAAYFRNGAKVFTLFAPGAIICTRCAKRTSCRFWTIIVQWGRVWTCKETMRDMVRYTGGGIRKRWTPKYPEYRTRGQKIRDGFRRSWRWLTS